MTPTLERQNIDISEISNTLEDFSFKQLKTIIIDFRNKIYTLMLEKQELERKIQELESKGQDKENICVLDFSIDYLKYIESRKEFLAFDNLLTNYLSIYFKSVENKPIECQLKIFYFPGEDYSEPMIKIIYSESKEFNPLKLRDEIEEGFKEYLAKNSKDLEEFKSYKKIQKNYRFIIRSEED
ncbi:MAG: hypothetical protein KGD63_00640 [Candidatus Lokiarchaeota archaeon]|nr:hypothetical protein [Candidatus Lokiarchaeota archaeon]